MKLKFFILVLFIQLNSYPLNAQWSQDPNINTPICTAEQNQNYTSVAIDGKGGAIIVWQDNRNNNNDVYAQRINHSGYIAWQENGIEIIGDSQRNSNPKIVTDSELGAIIFWLQNDENYDLYAQRIDENGNKLWAPNGIAINSSSGTIEDFDISEDENGDVLIGWQYSPISGSSDIYAQKINNDGDFLWSQNPTPVCLAPENQSEVQIVSDGKGGAIITWIDERDSLPDVYIQRVDSNGVVVWITNGLQLTTNLRTSRPSIIYDGNNSAIVCWQDLRYGLNQDIFGQKVDLSGNILWQQNGIQINPFNNNTNFYWDRLADIKSDGEGGVIIFWNVADAVILSRNYVQRINGNGNKIWDTTGVLIGDLTGTQGAWNILLSESDSWIVVWDKSVNPFFERDLFAQRIDKFGNKLWQDDVAISTAVKTQNFSAGVTDTLGGAILAWRDYRATNNDIYAQQVGANGELGSITEVNDDIYNYPATFFLLQNYPNPFNPTTKIKYQIPELSFVTLNIYDVLGNEIATLVNEEKSAGTYEVELDGTGLTSGVYFYKLQIGNFVETKKMVLLR